MALAWLLGKRATPEEIVHEARQRIRREMRATENAITSMYSPSPSPGTPLTEKTTELMHAEKLATKELRKAQEGQRILAKEIVLARRSINDLHTQKARLGSLFGALQLALANHRIGSAFATSVEVMVTMKHMLSVPQLSALAHDLSRELSKAGLVEEALSGAVTWEEEEDGADADEQVQQLLDEFALEAAARLAPVPAANRTEENAPTPVSCLSTLGV